MKIRHGLMLGVAAVALLALAGMPSQPAAQTPTVAIDMTTSAGW